MQVKNSTTTTIRTMKDDDIACQMVLRYQQDPNCLYELHSFRASRVAELADKVFVSQRLPQTVGEWVSVVLHYGTHANVVDMRKQARQQSQGSYLRAERWLRLIDRART